MTKQQGFTIIELIIVIVVLLLAGFIFWDQKNSIAAQHEDATSKADINAIAYALDNIYFKQHNYYPQNLNTKTFTIISPETLQDSNGNLIGTQNSNYRYAPNSCTDGKCKGYTLRAKLEQEADYIKSSN